MFTEECTHLDEDASSGGENVVAGVTRLNDQIVAASLLIVQRLLQSDKPPAMLCEASPIDVLHIGQLLILLRESHKVFFVFLL